MIIDELYYPAREEETRTIPSFIPEGTLVNVATYAKNELISIFHGVHFDAHCGLFHLGLSQVYTKMVNMFRFSGLWLTEHQSNLLRLVLKDVNDTVRNPSTAKYEDLHLGFYGFIDALRREHQERETKEEEGYKVIDEEGTVAKSVQKIMKEFYEVQIAAEEHHKQFEDYTSRIPEITKIIFSHFVRIFPPDQRIPITVMPPNGYYASAISQEWFNPTN